MVILRRLRHHPAPFLLTFLTIALVTGVGTAIFAVVNATLLRPLPFPDSDRLVRIFTLPPGLTEARQRNPLHSLDFVRCRERARSLDALEVIWPRDRGLSGAGDPIIVKAGEAAAEHGWTSDLVSRREAQFGEQRSVCWCSSRWRCCCSPSPAATSRTSRWRRCCSPRSRRPGCCSRSSGCTG